MTQFTLFETAIGWASLAWTEAGLAGVRLPAADPEAQRRAVVKRFPDAVEASPPPQLAGLVAGIQALLRGEPADLTGAPLDPAHSTEFNLKVYALAQAVPPGETRTYGQLAEQLGDRLLARDVGQALGRNPWPIVVPCHRITAAGGKLGGFSAPGGAATKLKLLAIEGAAVATAQPPAQPSLFG